MELSTRLRDCIERNNINELIKRELIEILDDRDDHIDDLMEDIKIMEEQLGTRGDIIRKMKNKNTILTKRLEICRRNAGLSKNR